MIQVRIDESSYRDVQAALRRIRQEVPRQAVSVMSKALTKVKQVLVDRTYEEIALTKGRIAEDITSEVSGDIASGDLERFRAIVRSKGKPVGLIYFATPKDWSWQNPVPIRVKIYRHGNTSTLRHAFIAPGRGGSRTLHVWERQTHMGKTFRRGLPYSRMPHEYRFPLERLTTLRIQDVQAKPEFTAHVLDQGATIVLKDLSVSIDGVLNG